MVITYFNINKGKTLGGGVEVMNAEYITSTYIVGLQYNSNKTGTWEVWWSSNFDLAPVSGISMMIGPLTIRSDEVPGKTRVLVVLYRWVYGTWVMDDIVTGDFIVVV